MQIIVTQEEKDRKPGYALGVATGQVDGGFSITTVANKPDGVFDGTYTITIPDGKITQSQFQAIIDNPEQQVVTPDYREQRKAAYPYKGDQLDMLYRDLKAAGIEGEFTAAIEAVKNAHPKP
jgi:ABC-type nitrate/sulfonate/bicarbonate transport system substrate-binding protein